MVSNTFVVLMGMGTVFFGLVCIVLLIMIMGKIVGGKQAAKPAAISAAPAAAQPAISTGKSEQRDPALVAVISAALAEELGMDVSQVCVTSISRVN